MVIPRIWRASLTVLSVSFLAACGGQTGNVKVYQVKHPEGLVRKQQNEVKPFKDAAGYLCQDPEDFRDTVTCTGAAVKVYKLNPSRGLVRSQAGEVIRFEDARGYLCVSPTDFKTILENCSTTNSEAVVSSDIGA